MSRTPQRADAAGMSSASNSPDDAVRVAKAIDAEFANSPYETKTETESAFAASWVKQFGNIEFLILTIGTVVFFTLLLVTGNTMAISVRERTSELARFQGHRLFRPRRAFSSCWQSADHRPDGRIPWPGRWPGWRCRGCESALNGLLPAWFFPWN